MTQTLRRSRVTAGVAFLVATVVASLLATHGISAELLSEAAGVEKGDRKGVGGLVQVANTIQRPALFVCFAILPLALIGGGALTMIGSQRGPRILGFGIGGAMILAAVSGFAA